MEMKGSGGKKRMDDDSDEDDHAKNTQEPSTQKSVDLMDMGAESKAPTFDLLGDLGDQPASATNTGSLLDFGAPSTTQPGASNTLDLFATPAASSMQAPPVQQ
jgi:hypothetical protein